MSRRARTTMRAKHKGTKESKDNHWSKAQGEQHKERKALAQQGEQGQGQEKQQHRTINR